MTLSRKIDKPIHPVLRMENHPITEVNEHKHLGVTLTSNLTWTIHIDNIVTKASTVLSMLRPLKMKVDRVSLEQMYKSFVRPLLEYADVVWDIPSNKNLKDKIENVQIKAARIVSGAIERSNRANLYQELGWVKMETRRLRHGLTLFYKIMTEQAPRYLIDNVPATVGDMTHYNLRNRDNLQYPRAGTDYYNNSFYPRVVKAWNLLSNNIKVATSVSSFKHLLSMQDTPINKLYRLGDRLAQVYHSRLRQGCSKLNHDLYHNIHVVPSPACECGNLNETAKHYFFECPRYVNERQNLMAALSLVGPSPIQTLLFGDENFTFNENKAISKSVQAYIMATGRFTNIPDPPPPPPNPAT
jgi:hypothetical protein